MCTNGTAASPRSCGAPGWLLDGGEVAAERIERGGELGFPSLGGALGFGVMGKGGAVQGGGGFIARGSHA
jgi:hypothetical protein